MRKLLTVGTLSAFLALTMPIIDLIEARRKLLIEIKKTTRKQSF